MSRETHEAWADADRIREMYFNGTAPNGKSYSYDMLARHFRVSQGTIINIVKARPGHTPWTRYCPKCGEKI